MNKKGGIVTDLIGGTGNLIILVVIVLVIISTILGANLLTATRTAKTVTNESDYTGAVVFANRTGYTLADSGVSGSYAITTVWNSSQYGAGSGGYNLTVATTQVSINSVGLLKNATNGEYANISVSYTYSLLSNEEAITNNLSSNFSKGINNVSLKIPTILLIGAVVLLFGVLVLLVSQAKRMGLFAGGGGSL